MEYKMEIKVAPTYETRSTELAAALQALGWEVPENRPDRIRRIFDEKHPAKQGTGLGRGGFVEYRLLRDGSQFDGNAEEIAAAYMTEANRKPEQPGSDTFDNVIAELREQTKGTPAGQTLEKLCLELPKEIARYIAAAMSARRELIDVVCNRSIPERVRAKKGDGHFIEYSPGLPKEQVKQLLAARARATK